MAIGALPQVAQIGSTATRRSARFQQGASGHDVDDSLSNLEKSVKHKAELLELMLNQMSNAALLKKLNDQRQARGLQPYEKRHSSFVETLKNHLRAGTNWRVIKKPKKKQDSERMELFTQVKQHLKNQPHLTFRDLAGKVDCSLATIHKIMKENGYKKKAAKRRRVAYAQKT